MQRCLDSHGGSRRARLPIYCPNSPQSQRTSPGSPGPEVSSSSLWQAGRSPAHHNPWGWGARLLAGHGHNPFQHFLLFCHHEGLGQPATGHGALDGLLVVAGYRDDPLRARHLHLQVGVVGHSNELGQSRSAEQSMLGALQIHYLKPDRFSAKMIFVSEENIHFDLADWRAR